LSSAAVKAEDKKAEETAELGDAAVAEAPEDAGAAAAEGAAPAPAGGDAMDVDGAGVVSDLPPRSPSGPGIMASDHGDEQ
jgi:hypothetical protein